MSFSEGSFNKDIGWNVVCLVLLWLHLVFQYLPLHLTDYTLSSVICYSLSLAVKVKKQQFFSEIISKIKLLHFVISSIDDMKCIYIDDYLFIAFFPPYESISPPYESIFFPLFIYSFSLSLHSLLLFSTCFHVFKHLITYGVYVFFC